MNIIDSLITNRTGGSYNHTDLNRVGQAVAYLRDKLNNQYGFNISMTTKIDWTMVDLAQAGARLATDAYLQNIATIRSTLTMPTGTPGTPSTMRFLTAKEANDIEKILQAVEVLLNNISAAWFYSNDIYSGEV